MREFPKDTEVWRGVDAVDGPKWAAAICDVTLEAVMGWLERGFIPTARCAVLLAEASEKRGVALSMRLLSGLPIPSAETNGRNKKGLSTRRAGKTGKCGLSSDPTPAPVAILVESSANDADPLANAA